jgi:eukaryotic-like serine/threonine-protein kinase
MYEQTGKFRDIVELGKGGMGDVFLTVASGPGGFNKLLVVKRLRASLASDPDFLLMFLNEARLAARLNHPNIVHTYEVGSDDSGHYIAMEYLQGQSLNRLIRRAGGSGALSLQMQLRVLADALAGLHYAHELTDYDGTPLAIVHRDVSPANIFVLYDGQVKLVDFGIAKTVHSGETKAGIFKGKIQYVSPEQYTGGEIDRRADIFSAGVVLWEAVTGRRMWQDVRDLTVMHRVGTGDIPRPTSVNPRVPAHLEAMCMKALALRKEDRYPTAAAFQAEVEDFLRELGSRVSARDVGALASTTFADDRAQIKILIEDQLRLVRENPETQSLVPTVTLQQDTSSRPKATEASLFLAFTPPSNRRRNVVIALGAGLVAILAGLVLWSSPAPTPSAAPASAVPAPAPSAALPQLASEPSPASPPASAAPPQVKLTLEIEPENARVLVDGALLPSSGEIAKFAKDDGMHKVRAEAPGFRPKSEWVRFDSDNVVVRMSLKPAPAKGRKDGGAPSQSDTAMQETEMRRRSAAQPSIDTADPWTR